MSPCPRRPALAVSLAAGLAVSWLFVLPAGAAGAAETPEIDWSDSSRDVYVDGEHEPGAIILTADSEQAGDQLAVLSSSLERAFVVQLESLEVAELPLSHFTFTATGATSRAEAPAVSRGRATRIRDRRSTFYVISAGDHTLVIAPHQGLAGPLQTSELFQAAPAWQRRAARYEPDAEAVTALAANQREVDVTVAFGTWCGDSRNYVPKLVRALEEAGNPRIHLQLVAIHRAFDRPSELVLGERVTNVPTVIVREDGEEIGRIVETPAGASVEGDLAAILGGALAPHPGRWEREGEIARGKYAYRDAEDRRLGGESWELYHTAGGGRLLHSLVRQDGRAVEIWHRRDPQGASEFVELTRRFGDELSRTRIWIEDGELRALTRGNATGIVEQHLRVAPGTSFLLPCAAEAGFDWLRLAAASQATLTGFLLPADQPTAGKVVTLAASPGGRETVATGAGQHSALRLATRHADGESEWWLDDELGIALRGTAPGLGEVTLEELSVAGETPSGT